jgi:photosystem II stability/assembly factor-like uncharacterized protein
MDFVSKDTGFIAGQYGSRGMIFKTTDGGANWDSVQVPAGSGQVLRLHFATSKIGYATALYIKDKYWGGIWKTTDGGNTWESVYQLSPDNSAFYGIYAIDRNTCYAVGEKGLIMVSQDGGVTWKKQATSVTANFYEVAFYDGLTGYIVGEGGVVLSTTNGGGITSISESHEGLSAKVFPNPSTGIFNLTFDIMPAGAQVDVFNSIGQKLMARDCENILQLNLTNYPAGIYYYQAHAKGRTLITGKLVRY